MQVLREIYSGAVLEQEVRIASDRVKNLDKAFRPRQRFASDAERDKHKTKISLREFVRKVNSTFTPKSLYSTLTMNDEHEVHTFDDAARIFENYKRRLRHLNPDAQIIFVMGRGKSTDRIHYHMLSNGLSPEDIRGKWTAGAVNRIQNLRSHNFYDGVDHGADYTGLAVYLFNHWTPEQGGRRYRQTSNVAAPEIEPARKLESKIRYTPNRPPVLPKGYKRVGVRSTEFGYICYMSVRTGADKPKNRK